MDYADIPAAAALLGANLGAEAARSATRLSASPTSSTQQLLDLSRPAQSETFTMQSNAAAALLGAAHFYPAAAATIMDANAAMAQQYYAQNVANFANMGYMPTYPSVYGMLPAAYALGAAPSPFFGAGGTPGGAGAPLHQFDMDAQALQQQMINQFSQASPEQQAVYYEGIRQQLHAASSDLNDNQKQALLQFDPSLSFAMKPLELDANANLEGSKPAGPLKRARTCSTADAATKKPRKSKASSSSSEPSPNGLLIAVESPGSSSSAPTRPATPRGRPPGSSKKTESGVQLTKSGKKKSMTPQAEEMRARKAKMTWPKGTFIVRLQDVKVRNGKDHIWLVDNHQLLQRYNNESGAVQPDGSRVYQKTDRYTGWMCHEGFHYFPLFDERHVLNQDGNKVTVMFPSEEELQEAISFEEQVKIERSIAAFEAEKAGCSSACSNSQIAGLTSSQLARLQQRSRRSGVERRRAEEQVVAASASSSVSSSTSQLQMPRLQPMQLLREEGEMLSSSSQNNWESKSEVTSSYEVVEKIEDEEYEEYEVIDEYP
ncbi:hypothetical protein PFISCL1PPCAC_21296 [Pristionchus fissidentatus]|uniref:Uncharacterized protein n=1 Tax=Pristionchus fissidentatus TaxID=1538716 RepID=A0AAV5WGX6_9BILA|nr:hypothetical protein PFISCL1PPCAC_21296 [Pristionchus fissidentatus]